METLTHGSRTLGYQDSGRGTPPLLFVHGLAADPTLFEQQIAHYRARHRTLVVQMPGFGSMPAADKHSIEAYADDLAHACTELAVDRPVVVGHSAGALYALALAQRAPELVRAVVSIDAPICLPPVVLESFGPFSAALATPHYRQALLEFALASLNEASAQGLRERLTASLSTLSQAVVREVWQSIGMFDAERALEVCRVPLLHIAAALPSESERILRAQPRARVAALPGDHFPHISRPVAFHTLLDDFLKGLEAR